MENQGFLWVKGIQYNVIAIMWTWLSLNSYKF
jgi:hypothetical protein